MMTGMNGKAPVRLEATDDLEPIHVRHHHVEEDRGRAATVDRVERVLTVVRALYFVSARLESGAQNLYVVFVIVDNENSLFRIVSCR